MTIHGPTRGARTAPGSRTGRLAAVAILVASVGATVGGMLHTSATFDEVITIAAGARGFEIGRFDIVPDHPPLMQYLYGLPAHLTRPSFPPEPGPGLLPDRYWYAAAFFSERGNDPELLVLLPRLVATICAGLLSVAVFLTTRRRFGTPSAVFAMLLCAFLPDLLAHGGVAYSDVPLALCWICTLYATDAVVREPSVRRAAVAGAWLALSLGTKFSAMTIAPAAVLLLLAEAASRARDRGWRGAIIRAAAVAEVTT
jgi:dolichyl-phosphate-mannose--protein O-mannosyl transferase